MDNTFDTLGAEITHPNPSKLPSSSSSSDIAKLRIKLRRWEMAYAAKHGGQRPTQEIIRGYPQVEAKYREYARMKRIHVRDTSSCKETSKTNNQKLPKTSPKSNPLIENRKLNGIIHAENEDAIVFENINGDMPDVYDRNKEQSKTSRIESFDKSPLATKLSVSSALLPPQNNERSDDSSLCHKSPHINIETSNPSGNMRQSSSLSSSPLSEERSSPGSISQKKDFTRLRNILSQSDLRAISSNYSDDDEDHQLKEDSFQKNQTNKHIISKNQFSRLQIKNNQALKAPQHNPTNIHPAFSSMLKSVYSLDSTSETINYCLNETDSRIFPKKTHVIEKIQNKLTKFGKLGSVLAVNDHSLTPPDTKGES